MSQLDIAGYSTSVSTNSDLNNSTLFTTLKAVAKYTTMVNGEKYTAYETTPVMIFKFNSYSSANNNKCSFQSVAVHTHFTDEPEAYATLLEKLINARNDHLIETKMISVLLLVGL